MPNNTNSNVLFPIDDEEEKIPDIVQIKFVNKSSESLQPEVVQPVLQLVKQLKNIGYLPIVTPSDTDINIMKPDDIITYIGSTPITVKDLIDTKMYKNSSINENDKNEIRLDAIRIVNAIEESIRNINTKIQMVFPDHHDENTDDAIVSMITLNDGYREYAVTHNGAITYKVQSNNPEFLEVIMNLTENNEEKSGLLIKLTEYLDKKISGDFESKNSPDVNNNIGLKPTEQPVSIDEIVEDINNTKSNQITEDTTQN